MGMHTEEELREKRLAIQLAADGFVIHFLEGQYEDEAILYHAIENLNSLVVELKRG